MCVGREKYTFHSAQSMRRWEVMDAAAAAAAVCGQPRSEQYSDCTLEGSEDCEEWCGSNCS